MDKPKLIDQFSDELEILIQKAHRSGLSYWEILGELPDMMKRLIAEADSEYWSRIR